MRKLEGGRVSHNRVRARVEHGSRVGVGELVSDRGESDGLQVSSDIQDFTARVDSVSEWKSGIRKTYQVAYDIPRMREFLSRGESALIPGVSPEGRNPRNHACRTTSYPGSPPAGTRFPAAPSRDSRSPGAPSQAPPARPGNP